jgi:SAM-dependent methyltransferase
MRRLLKEAARAALGLAKPALRPLYRRLWMFKAKPWVRRIMTSNYRSGQVALGERNAYGFYGGWITVDQAGADHNVNFRDHERLPFPDGSQSVVYSAHMIEHIDLETLKHLLRESFRILKPGGFIRLEAPDSEKSIKAYRENDVAVFKPAMDVLDEVLVRRLGWPAEYGEPYMAFMSVISSYELPGVEATVPVKVSKREMDEKLASLSLDDFLAWAVSLQTPEQFTSCGHVNPLYPAKIERLLKEAGFREVAFMEPRRTRIPDVWLETIERTHRANYSFFVEAKK